MDNEMIVEVPYVVFAGSQNGENIDERA